MRPGVCRGGWEPDVPREEGDGGVAGGDVVGVKGWIRIVRGLGGVVRSGGRGWNIVKEGLGREVSVEVGDCSYGGNCCDE